MVAAGPNDQRRTTNDCFLEDLHVRRKTLTGPKIRTALPGPNAKRILEGDEKYISPSYTRSYPLVAKSGRGIVVTDVDGNEFFDFSAGIAVTSTGHCHPQVVAAIQKQAAELIHMSGTDFYYESLVTLAERLSKIAPMPGPHKIYYGNSGTEAIECALKLARYHTKRQNIIAFYGAFHGRTMGALSLTASKPQQRRRFAPLVPGVTHVRYPDVYRGCSAAPKTPRNLRSAAPASSKTSCSRPRLPPEEVAAIFVEPIQGEGGYVVAPTVFMQELRRICDRHGILLVVDEVQSGVGRTGKWWAVEHTGVQPDIVCMRQRHRLRHAARHHHDPRRNHGLGPGFACLDFRRQSGLHRRGAGHARCDRAAKSCCTMPTAVGNHMLQRMADWPQKHKLVGDVRGRGLMIGVEFVKDKKTKEYAAAERDRIVELAFERGILFLGCGPSTIRIAPPLIVTKEEADVAVDVLEECIGLAIRVN